jgi:hypothetical protein
MLPEPNPYATSENELRGPSAPANRRTVVLIVAGVSLLVLAMMLATAATAFLLGAISAETQLYHRRASLQAEKIRLYLGQHEDQFADVKINETSDGRSLLSGTVDSQADLDQLRTEVQRLFGEEMGAEMTAGVEIREAAAVLAPEGE